MAGEQREVPDHTTRRSVIFLMARVYCARCDWCFTLHDISKGLFAHHLRREGWSDTNREGWVCRACLVAEREQRTTGRTP